jgi:hypothetical protein
MRRRWLLVAVVVVIGCVGLLVATFGVNGPSLIDAEALERETRAALPAGTPLSTVEEFLRSRRVEYSFDASSGIVSGGIRRVQGGNIFVHKSFAMRIHFDDALRLRSIDTEAHYTGL